MRVTKGQKLKSHQYQPHQNANSTDLYDFLFEGIETIGKQMGKGFEKEQKHKTFTSSYKRRGTPSKKIKISISMI